MSTIRYAGTCNWCGKHVQPGRGDFQSIGSLSKDIRKHFTGANFKTKWLIRCFGCKGLGNKSVILSTQPSQE